jgi:hypothetical protein
MVFLCLALSKFFGLYIAWLAFAALMTSFFLYLWLFNKNFRSKILKSPFRSWKILGWIFFIIFWAGAFVLKP